MNNIEPFVIRGGLEIRGDGFELRLRGPSRAGRVALASVLQLTLAQGVRRVYEMQFVFRTRGFEQLPEPRALRPRVAGEVEHDGNAFRQQGADVGRQRILKPGGVLDEYLYVGDLAGEQPTDGASGSSCCYIALIVVNDFCHPANKNSYVQCARCPRCDHSRQSGV